jgi:hypothetical protein
MLQLVRQVFKEDGDDINLWLLFANQVSNKNTLCYIDFVHVPARHQKMFPVSLSCSNTHVRNYF